ncbi:MAG: YezD family protein [Nitrosomonas sp.]|nr:YezD family protein [Nitrosomonas sp.]MBK7365212.1 YezD family protein [Nitrosomonas sp.]
MDTKLDNTITQQAQTEILRAIASIQFGSVEIVIHNGQITQIEYREKIRIKANETIPSAKY